MLELQGFFLIYEIISIGLRAASLAIGFFVFNSALAAVALFSLVSVALNLSLILATLLAAAEYKKENAR
ncbi:hypothetical protein [Halomonas sp. E19]|uniref:hypothetical protein n=1 Tax=Halomonas sp. E19 TaxID=3397247 RepID=UPI0040346497